MIRLAVKLDVRFDGRRQRTERLLRPESRKPIKPHLTNAPSLNRRHRPDMPGETPQTAGIFAGWRYSSGGNAPSVSLRSPTGKRSYQSQRARLGGGLAPGLRLQFCQDGRHVMINRLGRNEQAFRYLAIGKTFIEQAEDVHLAPGQPHRVRAGRLPRTQSPNREAAPAHLAAQGFGHGRGAEPLEDRKRLVAGLGVTEGQRQCLIVGCVPLLPGRGALRPVAR